MSYDWLDALYDRRFLPPESEEYVGLPPAEDFEICPDCKDPYDPHSDWCPTHPSEGYLAMQDWIAGPEGAPCPVCEEPKPGHKHWCHEGPDREPSYRLTPSDFQPGGRYFDKESF